LAAVSPNTSNPVRPAAVPEKPYAWPAARKMIPLMPPYLLVRQEHLSGKR
jgi:hypothetical protein